MAEKKDTKKKDKKIDPKMIAIVAGLAIILVVIIIEVCVNLGGGKKPDETSTPVATKNPIAGIWKYEGVDSKYVFNEDGTCSFDFYNSSQKCTYTDDGSTVVLQYEGMTSTNTYAYRIEGNTLYIEDDFGDEVKYVKQ